MSGADLRADSDDAESLRLSVGSILMKSHLHQVLDADGTDCVLHIRICRPLHFDKFQPRAQVFVRKDDFVVFSSSKQEKENM